MFCVSPIRNFSIPQHTVIDAPSSSSFPPPHDPMSPAPVSQFEEMVETLTQVEAEEMQVEARETTGHNTPMAETREGLTQTEP